MNDNESRLVDVQMTTRPQPLWDPTVYAARALKVCHTATA